MTSIGYGSLQKAMEDFHQIRFHRRDKKITAEEYKQQIDAFLDRCAKQGPDFLSEVKGCIRSYEKVTRVLRKRR